MVRWSVVTRAAIDQLETPMSMSMSLRAYARHRGVALKEYYRQMERALREELTKG